MYLGNLKLNVIPRAGLYSLDAARSVLDVEQVARQELEAVRGGAHLSARVDIDTCSPRVARPQPRASGKTWEPGELEGGGGLESYGPGGAQGAHYTPSFF